MAHRDPFRAMRGSLVRCSVEFARASLRCTGRLSFEIRVIPRLFYLGSFVTPFGHYASERNQHTQKPEFHKARRGLFVDQKRPIVS